MIITEKITQDEKELYKTIAQQLKGSDRRLFKARIVNLLGRGGQTFTEKELGWNRRTVRKARRELASGVIKKDNFSARGRKRAEDHLPNLLKDIRELTQNWEQTQPSLQATRRYKRITVKELRRQLILSKGYRDQELPTNATLNNKLNSLGYRVRATELSNSPPPIPQIEAKFEQLNQIHNLEQKSQKNLQMICAAQASTLLRVLAHLKVNRVEVKSLDRNISSARRLTAFGIFLPDEQRLFLYFKQGKMPGKFMIDCIQACFLDIKEEFPQLNTLLQNQDENMQKHTHRTQFMQRLAQGIIDKKLTVQFDTKLTME